MNVSKTNAGPLPIKRRLLAEDVGLTLPTFGSYAPVETSSQNTSTENLRIVRNAKGKIRGIRVLENISFQLTNGERLALLGANGSGKTSLLQVLSGAIPPDTGRVLCSGKPTSLININLGMQLAATGHRNITLRGLASGFNRDEIENRREEIAKFTELGDFLHLPVTTYSAGMRMRLSFAIVTSFDPEILILDEWLSAGDAEFREKASQRMEQFAERAGIIVLASHNKALLEQVCTSAIWLRDGRIASTGTVTEVFKDYMQRK